MISSSLGHGGISSLGHGIGLGSGLISSSIGHGGISAYGHGGITTLGHGGLSLGHSLGGYASAYASSPYLGSSSAIKVISNDISPLHFSEYRYGSSGIHLGINKLFSSPLRFTVTKSHNKW